MHSYNALLNANCIMHNAFSNAKCIGFNALSILIFQDFPYFLVFLDFEPISSQLSACFTANSRRFLQRCFQKHMTAGKNRDDMLWQMLKDSRTKNLNSQLSNTSPTDYPRTTLQEPHFLQNFLCKGFLLICFPKVSLQIFSSAVFV